MIRYLLLFSMLCGLLEFNKANSQSVEGMVGGAGGGGSNGADGAAASIANTTTTFSATPTFTVTASTVHQNFKITLTANVTSSTLTLTNATAGEYISFSICQDGTGSRTFVWPTNVIDHGTINATASACSNQMFRYDGTNAVMVTPMTVAGADPGVTIPGLTSGSATIKPVAIAGSAVFTIQGGNTVSVVPTTCGANNFSTGVASTGIPSCAQPALANLSDYTAQRTFSRSFHITDPVVGDSYRMSIKFGQAVTITRVTCNVIGGTNVVINLMKVTEATSGSGGTQALTADLTCTAGAQVASTTFSSATVAARIPLALKITSVSGTNTDVQVDIEGTID